MARIFAILATLAFGLTAFAAAAPNAAPDAAPIAEPQSCGGQAIPGSDCGFNDQCRSCRCRNGICQ